MPHVGARHRRRCVDLVLRSDFDGAWHRVSAFGSIRRTQRADSPCALPEVAPLDIVGTSRDEYASTLVPNNVKDGTPARRAPRAPRAPGGWVEFEIRNSQFVMAGRGLLPTPRLGDG